MRGSAIGFVDEQITIAALCQLDQEVQIRLAVSNTGRVCEGRVMLMSRVCGVTAAAHFRQVDLEAFLEGQIDVCDGTTD